MLKLSYQTTIRRKEPLSLISKSIIQDMAYLQSLNMQRNVLSAAPAGNTTRTGHTSTSGDNSRAEVRPPWPTTLLTIRISIRIQRLSLTSFVHTLLGTMARLNTASVKIRNDFIPAMLSILWMILQSNSLPSLPLYQLTLETFPQAFSLQVFYPICLTILQYHFLF